MNNIGPSTPGNIIDGALKQALNSIVSGVDSSSIKKCAKKLIECIDAYKTSTNNSSIQLPKITKNYLKALDQALNNIDKNALTSEEKETLQGIKNKIETKETKRTQQNATEGKIKKAIKKKFPSFFGPTQDSLQSTKSIIQNLLPANPQSQHSIVSSQTTNSNTKSSQTALPLDTNQSSNAQNDSSLEKIQTILKDDGHYKHLNTLIGIVETFRKSDKYTKLSDDDKKSLDNFNAKTSGTTEIIQVCHILTRLEKGYDTVPPNPYDLAPITSDPTKPYDIVPNNIVPNNEYTLPQFFADRKKQMNIMQESIQNNIRNAFPNSNSPAYDKFLETKITLPKNLSIMTQEGEKSTVTIKEFLNLDTKTTDTDPTFIDNKNWPAIEAFNEAVLKLLQIRTNETNFVSYIEKSFNDLFNQEGDFTNSNSIMERVIADDIHFPVIQTNSTEPDLPNSLNKLNNGHLFLINIERDIDKSTDYIRVLFKNKIQYGGLKVSFFNHVEKNKLLNLLHKLTS